MLRQLYNDDNTHNLSWFIATLWAQEKKKTVLFFDLLCKKASEHQSYISQAL